MWRNPQTDDTQLLAFLEENQDMVDRSRDLASMKAWALFHVGRLQEAEAMNRTLLERVRTTMISSLRPISPSNQATGNNSLGS